MWLPMVWCRAVKIGVIAKGGVGLSDALLDVLLYSSRKITGSITGGGSSRHSFSGLSR